VIAGVPTEATSLAGTVAVSEVALTKLVASAEPAKFTVAPLTKFVPVTVSVKLAAPATTLLGLSPVRVGTGFPVTALIVNVSGPDVPPPDGFVTVTAAVPEPAMRLAGTVAVSEVALTKVVVSGVPPKEIDAPVTKFVPVTVSGNAPEPAVALEGESSVRVGGGLVVVTALMVKVNGLDVPPPDGFVTVTATGPAFVMRLAGTMPVSEVALTKVVVSGVPPKEIDAPLMKFVPVTVSGNAAEPAVALDGESSVRVGGGLVVVTALIVKVSGLEVPPPGAGFVTVI
jgi:hypothetical protein